MLFSQLNHVSLHSSILADWLIRLMLPTIALGKSCPRTGPTSTQPHIVIPASRLWRPRWEVHHILLLVRTSASPVKHLYIAGLARIQIIHLPPLLIEIVRGKVSAEHPLQG